jgi:hypothetical protein
MVWKRASPLCEALAAVALEEGLPDAVGAWVGDQLLSADGGVCGLFLGGAVGPALGGEPGLGGLGEEGLAAGGAPCTPAAHVVGPPRGVG